MKKLKKKNRPSYLRSKKLLPRYKPDKNKNKVYQYHDYQTYSFICILLPHTASKNKKIKTLRKVIKALNEHWMQFFN